MSKTPEQLVEQVAGGDRVALARLITRVESRAPDVSRIMAAAYGRSRGVECIGITGPPGAGKSTLMDQMIQAYRDAGKTVGVLAVDPSSPFSGGAVLGDRVRMQRHALDDGVYIRSLGSRGRHGGVSRATRDIRALLDVAGLDVILLETVGVGQTELDVMEIADCTVVILVPEAGDAVQTLKAGLLEIADVFVVNKADRAGADRMMADLRTLIMMRGTREGWETPILPTVANQAQGIDALMQALVDHRDHREQVGAKTRAFYDRQALKEVLLERVDANLDACMSGSAAVAGIVSRLERGELDPHTAADEIAEAVADRSMLLAGTRS